MSPERPVRQRGYGIAAAALCLSVMVGASTVATAAGHAGTAPNVGAHAIPATDWPSYLNGAAHTSYNPAETAINVDNASSLHKEWSFTAGQGYLSSPVVADGAVYIGANNGWFYMLNAATGALEHRIFLGTVNITSCPPPPTGMVSTAAVAVNPATNRPTVYVSAPNGHLYALSATTLAIEWRSVIAIPSNTVNNYFDWSSPTVANGRIYVGVSSNCDSPLVRAGVIGYEQSNGAKIKEFYTVPAGQVGGSVWSSVAVAPNGDVFASTGNGPETTGASQLVGDSESIIKLSPTLNFISRYQVPTSDEGFDTDFGASPVFFGNDVGACNKNGIFYALNQATMHLAWKKTISGPGGGNELCIAAAVWNGRDLFVATPQVTIGSATYEGTIQERTTSGALVWVRGLPNAVDGTASLDGAGVLAVGTFDQTATPNETYLIDAANGVILHDVISGGDFAQSAFAENRLYTANQNGVYAWGVG